MALKILILKFFSLNIAKIQNLTSFTSKIRLKIWKQKALNFSARSQGSGWCKQMLMTWKLIGASCHLLSKYSWKQLLLKKINFSRKEEFFSCFRRKESRKIPWKHDSHDDDCEGGRRLTPGGVHSRRRTGKKKVWNFYVKSNFGTFLTFLWWTTFGGKQMLEFAVILREINLWWMEKVWYLTFLPLFTWNHVLWHFLNLINFHVHNVRIAKENFPANKYFQNLLKIFQIISYNELRFWGPQNDQSKLLYWYGLFGLIRMNHWKLHIFHFLRNNKILLNTTFCITPSR